MPLTRACLLFKVSWTRIAAPSPFTAEMVLVAWFQVTVIPIASEMDRKGTIVVPFIMTGSPEKDNG
ncbi:hypothetical protein D3C78_1496080 [compost metagenome]